MQMHGQHQILDQVLLPSLDSAACGNRWRPTATPWAAKSGQGASTNALAAQKSARSWGTAASSSDTRACKENRAEKNKLQQHYCNDRWPHLVPGVINNDTHGHIRLDICTVGLAPSPKPTQPHTGKHCMGAGHLAMLQHINLKTGPYMVLGSCCCTQPTPTLNSALLSPCALKLFPRTATFLRVPAARLVARIWEYSALGQQGA